MSKPEILEKSPMNVVEVKAALENIKKVSPDVELNFRAQKTLEYAQEAAKLATKKAQELYGKLVALEIPRLKDAHYHKLVDLLPTNEKQVKAILSAYHLTVSNESVKKITDVIGEYAAKAK